MCGAAVTTTVAGARGWRTPVAIVGVVLALAAIALVIAFLEISNDADRVAQAPASTPTPVPTAVAQVTQTATPAATPSSTPTPLPTPRPSATPARTPTPVPGTIPTPGGSPTTPGGTPTPSSGNPTPTTSGAIAEWPAGKSGWTVVMASTTSRADGEKRARDLQAKGQNVGLLESSKYSSLRSGFWVVFSGVYDSQSAAQKASEQAQSAAPGAYAREVKPR
jgi:hypothetical protein